MGEVLSITFPPHKCEGNGCALIGVVSVVEKSLAWSGRQEAGRCRAGAVSLVGMAGANEGEGDEAPEDTMLVSRGLKEILT